MTVAEFVAALERRAAEAERMQAQAPVAAVLHSVLDELRALDSATAGPVVPSAALDPPGMERHLTPEEVAALLRVPPGYPYRHARQLGGVKVGKYLRFPESAVRRRLERLR
ncbi:MAG: helix-turn-helix domain-containing protein [bacterium]